MTGIKKTKHLLCFLIAVIIAVVLSIPGQALAVSELKSGKCLKCHSEFNDDSNLVVGDFESRSNKAKSISVKTNGDKIQIIKFTKDTTVENAPNIKALKKPIPVAVTFVRKGSDLIATEIKAKPQIKVPEKQMISVQGLAKLLADGPEKTKYVLVDSRPPIRYEEGHIPGSVSMPFPKMPKLMASVLPKDKSELVIFYCGGFR